VTALAIAHSQRLTHTVGTNTLLTALATAHPSTAAADPPAAGSRAWGRLIDWWGERRCAAAWGDLVRPDAAATWQTPNPAAGGTSAGRATTGAAAGGGSLGFAVEYDTGTETLARVAAKLGDYADLAAAAGQILPVLFWLPSVARESALHRHLDPTGLLVATAAADHAATAGGPTGQVWRPAAPPERGRVVRRRRLTLDQLAAAWASTDTLTVGSVDPGLGWPSPDPTPPRRPPDPANSDAADDERPDSDADRAGAGSRDDGRDDGGDGDRGGDGLSWGS
jgi:hypothetical protein